LWDILIRMGARRTLSAMSTPNTLPLVASTIFLGPGASLLDRDEDRLRERKISDGVGDERKRDRGRSWNSSSLYSMVKGATSSIGVSDRRSRNSSGSMTRLDRMLLRNLDRRLLLRRGVVEPGVLGLSSAELTDEGVKDPELWMLDSVPEDDAYDNCGAWQRYMSRPSCLEGRLVLAPLGVLLSKPGVRAHSVSTSSSSSLIMSSVDTGNLG